MERFDWDDLRFFLAVARSGRLTAAARRLGADHATVSRRITSLEESLKAKLFERRPQGYALTGHGEQLLAKAESMETEALAIQSEIGGADMALSGTVRIGAPDGFGSTFLAPRFASLGKAYPGLELQLIAMPRLLSLSKREADVAITLAPPKEGKVVARKLCDYRLGLYASQDYLDAMPKVTAAEDLFAHRIVGYIDDLIFTPGNRLSRRGRQGLAGTDPEFERAGADECRGGRRRHRRDPPFHGSRRAQARPGSAGERLDHALLLAARPRRSQGRRPGSGGRRFHRARVEGQSRAADG